MLLCQEVNYVVSRSRYSNRAVTNSNNGDRPPARRTGNYSLIWSGLIRCRMISVRLHP